MFLLARSRCTIPRLDRYSIPAATSRANPSIILSGSVLLGKSPSSITFSGTVMEGFAVVKEADNAGLCEDDDGDDKREGEEDAAYVLRRSRRAPFGMNSVTMYVEP